MKHFLTDNPLWISLWFNLCWFVAVVWQNTVVLGLLLLPLLILITRTQQFSPLIILVMIGVSVDTSFTLLNIFQFNEPAFIIPVWLILLWMCFGIFIIHILSHLPKSPYWFALIGAISGPFSYVSGYYLEAVEFVLSLHDTIALLSITWAILLPTIAWLIKRTSNVEKVRHEIL